MNTSSFKSNVNHAACSMENNMRSICGLQAESNLPEIQPAGITVTLPSQGGRPGATYHPTTPEEMAAVRELLLAQIKKCQEWVASGPGMDEQGNPTTPFQGEIDSCQIFLSQFGPGTEGANAFGIPAEQPGGPGTDPGQTPSAGSFHTHSIDSFMDLLNFLKGSALFLLAAAVDPKMIVPTNIFLCMSLAYALRNKVKKFFTLNYIK